jgi:signal recognition particle receptor subunit alpha
MVPEPVASSSSSSAGKKGKEKTLWADRKLSRDELKSLDYSVGRDGDDVQARMQAYNALKVDKQMFEYSDEAQRLEPDDEKDIDIEVERGSGAGKSSGLFGWFQQLSGNKVLDHDDLRPVLENMRQALMTKNVVCD